MNAISPARCPQGACALMREEGSDGREGLRVPRDVDGVGRKEQRWGPPRWGRCGSSTGVTREVPLGRGLVRNLSLSPCVQPSVHSYVQRIQGEIPERAAQEPTAEPTPGLRGRPSSEAESKEKPGPGPWPGRGRVGASKAGRGPQQLAFGNRQHPHRKAGRLLGNVFHL